MDLTVYTQYYRCKTPDRQREIEACLRRNLNHPGIRKVGLGHLAAMLVGSENLPATLPYQCA